MLQAALSHLNLALINICEQARNHKLMADDQSNINRAAHVLTNLSADRNVSGENVVTEFCDSQNKRIDEDDAIGHAVGKAVHFYLEEPKEEADIASDGDYQSSPGVVEISGADEIVNDHEILDCEIPQVVNSREIVGTVNRQRETGDYSEFLTFSRGNLEFTPGDQSEGDHIYADMVKIMMDAFFELDEEAVQWSKLQYAAEVLGMSRNHVRTVFAHLETTHDGLIYAEEWADICKRLVLLHSREEIIDMIYNARRCRMLGRTLTATRSASRRFMLFRKNRMIMSYKSRRRLLWDTFLVLLLAYVAIALPLTLGFDNLIVLTRIDVVVDWLFFFDLLLNFRTTFVNEQRLEVWDWRLIAKHYLKTWFLLDLVSSVPLEPITAGMFPRNPTKLLKFGKAFKVTKMIRLTKVAKMASGSEVMDRLEEVIWEHNLFAVGRGFVLVGQLLVTGHWLACLLLVLEESVEGYVAGKDTNDLQKYIAAMYWAMMTMTTVGYGDVPMETDEERIFAVFAMIIGGASYGYIIGVMTTVMSHRDLDHRAFSERMDVVVSWLRTHYELPKSMRRRIWRHFKEFLTTRKAVQDTMILNDLPPQLKNDVSMALLPETIRCHYLFMQVSIAALSRLVSIMSQVKFRADEVVVNSGDQATGMFIMDRGFAQKEKGVRFTSLCSGGSFGEEVLLCDVSKFKYTVRTHSKVSMFLFPQAEFTQSFKDMQIDVATMTRNYYSTSAEEAQSGHHIMHAKPGDPSLLAGGPTGVTPGVPEEVLEEFDHIKEMLMQSRSGTNNSLGSIGQTLRNTTVEHTL